MVAIGDFVSAPNGSVAQVLSIFASGRLQVQIVERAGHHKKGDWLVWLPHGLNRDDIPKNDSHGVPQ